MSVTAAAAPYYASSPPVPHPLTSIEATRRDVSKLAQHIALQGVDARRVPSFTPSSLALDAGSPKPSSPRHTVHVSGSYTASSPSRAHRGAGWPSTLPANAAPPRRIPPGKAVASQSACSPSVALHRDISIGRMPAASSYTPSVQSQPHRGVSVSVSPSPAARRRRSGAHTAPSFEQAGPTVAISSRSPAASAPHGEQSTFDQTGRPILVLNAVPVNPTTCSESNAVGGKDTCPSGHILQYFTAPHDGCGCNVCLKAMRRGDTLWGCRICNYDKCDKCLGKVHRGLDKHGDAENAGPVSAMFELARPVQELKSDQQQFQRFHEAGTVTTSAPQEVPEHNGGDSALTGPLASLSPLRQCLQTGSVEASPSPRGCTADNDDSMTTDPLLTRRVMDAQSPRSPLRAQSPRSPRSRRESMNQDEYLRKNIEHLRNTKHKQERRISNLQKQVGGLHEQVTHYKSLYESSLVAAEGTGSDSLEISNLHQQLSAVQLVKNALNKENIDLHEQLQSAQKESKSAPTCVICMDNLVNMVCLPCRHLALCTFCGQQGSIESCPICRSHIEDRMQIFMP